MNRLEALTELIKERCLIDIASNSRQQHIIDYKIAAFDVVSSMYADPIIIDMMGHHRTTVYHYRSRIDAIKFDKNLFKARQIVRKLFLELI